MKLNANATKDASITAKKAFIAPIWPPKSGVGGMVAYLWGVGEKPVFRKTGAHAPAGVQFEKIAKTRAVRKGKFLRGKVSQGRPHPLSMASRSEGQTLGKKYIAGR